MRRGRSTQTTRRGCLLAAVTIVLTACEAAAPASTPQPGTTAPTAEPDAVKVAFIQDLSPQDAVDRMLPAFQGAELAFTVASAREDATATVQIVAFDIEGSTETARDVATEIASDPRFVAAIAAPNLPEQRLIADALRGTPLLSLSERGTISRGAFLRFVAPLPDQAAELARLAESLRMSRRGVCVAPANREAAPLARNTRRSLSRALIVTLASGVDDIGPAGCGVVIWTGFGAGAATLAIGLGADVRLIGGSGLRDTEFIEDAGRAAEGALSVCSCADVSSSLDVAARRFIQTYQSENGTAPGPYALEAWDAARVIVAGLDAAGPSRAALTSWLARVSRFEGLANSYAWIRGELLRTRSFVRTYEVVGGRWVPSSNEDQA